MKLITEVLHDVAENYSVLLGHDTAFVGNWALFQGSVMFSSSRTH